MHEHSSQPPRAVRIAKTSAAPPPPPFPTGHGHQALGTVWRPRAIRALADARTDPLEDGFRYHHIVQVSAGAAHSLALTDGGELFAWGGGGNGQLGVGKVASLSYTRRTPTRVVLEKAAKEKATALAEAAAVGAKGEGTGGGGHAEHGAEGTQTVDSRSTPKAREDTKGEAARSAELIHIVHASAGEAHSLCCDSDGCVYAFGLGAHHCLGMQGEDGCDDDDDDTADRHFPALVRSLIGERIQTVSAGLEHSAALSEDGRVFTWGGPANGKLGHGGEFEVASADGIGGNLAELRQQLPSLALPGMLPPQFARAAEESEAESTAHRSMYNPRELPRLHRHPHSQSPNMDPKPQTAGAGGGDASGRELRELFSFGVSNRMLGEGEGTGEATASAITIGHGGGPLRLGARPRMVVDLGVSASADVFAAEIAAGDQHTLVRLSNGELRAFGSNVSGALGLRWIEPDQGDKSRPARVDVPDTPWMDGWMAERGGGLVEESNG